jgi:hypothetical protein
LHNARTAEAKVIWLADGLTATAVKSKCAYAKFLQAFLPIHTVKAVFHPAGIRWENVLIVE